MNSLKKIRSNEKKAIFYIVAFVLYTLSITPSTVFGFYPYDLAIRCIKHNEMQTLKDTVTKRPMLITLRDKYLGTTLLHYSAGYNRVNMAEFFLKKGADINDRTYFGDTPMHYGGQKGHVDVMKCLKEHGADYDIPNAVEMTPLHDALRFGCYEAACKLIEWGADIFLRTEKGLTVLHFLNNGNESIRMLPLIDNCNSLINTKDCRGATPLHFAVKNIEDKTQQIAANSIAVIKKFLEAGANIDAEDCFGMTSFFLACLKLNPQSIKVESDFENDKYQLSVDLECCGEQVHPVIEFFKSKQVRTIIEVNQSLLHIATAYGDIMMLEALYQSQDDLKYVNKSGDSFQHVAARYDVLGSVRFWQKKGLDINKYNNEKKTPLHIAVEKKSYNFICSLSEWLYQDKDELNPDILNTLDSNGKTALQVAEEKGDRTAQYFLREKLSKDSEPKNKEENNGIDQTSISPSGSAEKAKKTKNTKKKSKKQSRKVKSCPLSLPSSCPISDVHEKQTSTESEPLESITSLSELSADIMTARETPAKVEKTIATKTDDEAIKSMSYSKKQSKGRDTDQKLAKVMPESETHMSKSSVTSGIGESKEKPVISADTKLEEAFDAETFFKLSGIRQDIKHCESLFNKGEFDKVIGELLRLHIKMDIGGTPSEWSIHRKITGILNSTIFEKIKEIIAETDRNPENALKKIRPLRMIPLELLSEKHKEQIEKTCYIAGRCLIKPAISGIYDQLRQKEDLDASAIREHISSLYCEYCLVMSKSHLKSIAGAYCQSLRLLLDNINSLPSSQGFNILEEQVIPYFDLFSHDLPVVDRTREKIRKIINDVFDEAVQYFEQHQNIYHRTVRFRFEWALFVASGNNLLNQSDAYSFEKRLRCLQRTISIDDVLVVDGQSKTVGAHMDDVDIGIRQGCFLRALKLIRSIQKNSQLNLSDVIKERLYKQLRSVSCILLYDLAIDINTEGQSDKNKEKYFLIKNILKEINLQLSTTQYHMMQWLDQMFPVLSQKENVVGTRRRCHPEWMASLEQAISDKDIKLVIEIFDKNIAEVYEKLEWVPMENDSRNKVLALLPKAWGIVSTEVGKNITDFEGDQCEKLLGHLYMLKPEHRDGAPDYEKIVCDLKQKRKKLKASWQTLQIAKQGLADHDYEMVFNMLQESYQTEYYPESWLKVGRDLVQMTISKSMGFFDEIELKNALENAQATLNRLSNLRCLEYLGKKCKRSIVDNIKLLQEFSQLYDWCTYISEQEVSEGKWPIPPVVCRQLPASLAKKVDDSFSIVLSSVPEISESINQWIQWKDCLAKSSEGFLSTHRASIDLSCCKAIEFQHDSIVQLLSLGLSPAFTSIKKSLSLTNIKGVELVEASGKFKELQKQTLSILASPDNKGSTISTLKAQRFVKNLALQSYSEEELLFVRDMLIDNGFKIAASALYVKIKSVTKMNM